MQPPEMIASSLMVVGDKLVIICGFGGVKRPKSSVIPHTNNIDSIFSLDQLYWSKY